LEIIMAVVIEPTVTEPAASPSSNWLAHDAATALALDSLGLPYGDFEGYTPLPARLMQGIVALSGLITGIVWLMRL
jgi:hypothetical protein